MEEQRREGRGLQESAVSKAEGVCPERNRRACPESAPSEAKGCSRAVEQVLVLAEDTRFW